MKKCFLFFLLSLVTASLSLQSSVPPIDNMIRPNNHPLLDDDQRKITSMLLFRANLRIQSNPIVYPYTHILCFKTLENLITHFINTDIQRVITSIVHFNLQTGISNKKSLNMWQTQVELLNSAIVANLKVLSAYPYPQKSAATVLAPLPFVSLFKLPSQMHDGYLLANTEDNKLITKPVTLVTLLKKINQRALEQIAFQKTLKVMGIELFDTAPLTIEKNKLERNLKLNKNTQIITKNSKQSPKLLLTELRRQAKLLRGALKEIKKEIIFPKTIEFSTMCKTAPLQSKKAFYYFLKQLKTLESLLKKSTSSLVEKNQLTHKALLEAIKKNDKMLLKYADLLFAFPENANEDFEKVLAALGRWPCIPYQKKNKPSATFPLFFPACSNDLPLLPQTLEEYCALQNHLKQILEVIIHQQETSTLLAEITKRFNLISNPSEDSTVSQVLNQIEQNNPPNEVMAQFLESLRETNVFTLTAIKTKYGFPVKAKVLFKSIFHPLISIEKSKRAELKKLFCDLLQYKSVTEVLTALGDFGLKEFIDQDKETTSLLVSPTSKTLPQSFAGLIALYDELIERLMPLLSREEEIAEDLTLKNKLISLTNNSNKNRSLIYTDSRKMPRINKTIFPFLTTTTNSSSSNDKEKLKLTFLPNELTYIGPGKKIICNDMNSFKQNYLEKWKLKATTLENKLYKKPIDQDKSFENKYKFELAVR